MYERNAGEDPGEDQGRRGRLAEDSRHRDELA